MVNLVHQVAVFDDTLVKIILTIHIAHAIKIIVAFPKECLRFIICFIKNSPELLNFPALYQIEYILHFICLVWLQRHNSETVYLFFGQPKSLHSFDTFDEPFLNLDESEPSFILFFIFNLFHHWYRIQYFLQICKFLLLK